MYFVFVYLYIVFFIADHYFILIYLNLIFNDIVYYYFCTI